MATLIPRAPPPNPHRHFLLHRPPTLSPQLRLRLPVRRLRLASPVAAIATVTAAVPPDDISQLNNRLRALVRRRGVSSAATSPMDPAQADAYLHMIREQQRLGLRQLRRHAAEPEYERDVGSNAEDEEEGAGRRKGMAARSSLGHRVDPRELEPGEYVVHKKVGVGKFVCISGEDGEDYVFIQYADAMAKLAVDQAARMLYRYNLPHEKKRPRNLSKLNDPSTWEKRRLKGKLAVQKMVVNLMELYLQRMRQRRPPYRKPEAMDQFASEFPYEPTPDQNQAFIDIENDLTERETPMDRLICGDVGFGKTEVAMRAIFIVVSTGYQAMVLAPTVILANQHYDVMSERFSNYPDIKVAIFSGAQSKDEKDELITKITNGHLQIIVGTHALLTERMAYNNLGLLVVDEEQKFGVQQKEKIASFKASIDVLTLSATPIPRTLYLALTGFRDASLMSTPPPERVAVKTYVSAFSRESALSAIKLELKRGGQVFYVVPRIKAIDDVLQFLKDSLPDVPMAIAHGKKVSKNIQLAMEKFSCGEIKILVCTHIIESGIDIPNANTMIVQYAELFGLAQLYQLRGRVGRSGREGFTYLFYTDKSLLSRIAMDRLGAIEEHSDLGQGFHVAEKDMGIRGFGSMFGEQQSGDVANVGIDLFFDMLFDSLSKVDHFRLKPIPYKDVQLDINISPHLSSEYISYLENPVELLNEAAKAAEQDIWNLMQFTEDLRQQYGKEPRDMELLLKKLYVRRMAADLGISRIYPSGKMIIMKTNMNRKVFRLMEETMASETHRNSLSFTGKEIKAELLVNLPDTLLLNWLFHCLADCYAIMPALVRY
ncbi:ATP-dependent DNA helicase At3g02060, chloroplastic-like isoform X1 [Triticum dicoccoides]|uniref:ATP-dependent DNA helicase At3g02060, chloroplastic-like isoform X1 n=1 Tax=Triticum dicoccoides TaxID=85692 RepID=UPI000E789BD0|nr:ATP-dependent DNA helicase At3g02060, chloroplastic-like isoform X1 [Triticum dicoccoides]XP_037430294.1 ATP-dependent DNA helicase At3g02060, chloroplastic-like isoform X1 [Triticum dicoccoides]XP_037430295.1 ATP-dependent DNA helicase At3g02060, chloroplastic-like isoform X1 [Triticum dicoccoides]XP_037430296.1 ATP-dependent DNA helicase At3g02060, chloroplastic-like isoform X1 [Triticum dicoccoides]